MCSIRPMTLDDLPAVEEIERDCFALPWSHASFVDEIVKNKAARYLVVDDEGVIAYAGMWLVLDEAHITNIAVRRDRRGQGMGERVTAALMTLARDLGMRYMTLEVRRSNQTAQKLYHKLGFVDVGYRRGYYEDNHEDALIMVVEDLQTYSPPPRGGMSA